MGKITVTAAEGVRVNATIQKFQTFTRTVPELKDGMGNVIAPAKTEEFSGWNPQQIVSFASESREFDIGPDQRVLVEEQPV